MDENVAKEQIGNGSACKCGAPITKVFKSGKHGKYCSTCMDRAAGRLKGEWRAGNVTCPCCSQSFAPAVAHQKYCSSRCHYRARDRRDSGSGLDRAAYLAAVVGAALPRRAFNCAHCGRLVHRKASGTNTANGYINKYCSLPCRDAGYAAAALSTRLSKGLFSKCFGLFCEVCRSPFVSRREKRFCRKACDAIARAQVEHVRIGRAIQCRGCKTEFCLIYGRSKSSLCVPCAQSRARAHRLSAKVVRRLRLKAASVEPVDPFVVFERDGWHCQLCGIATPRDKRGTNDPDAPELDHVIALAGGGEHSYRNTQCACRR
jgi:hypothetical protein